MRPERVGLAPDRLERLTAHMNRAVADGVMVGGVGMIARRGGLAYRQAYGEADRERGVPMSVDTLFRIYSMSKPITGVAVMLLYEEGRFFLNDPIARYLPELADLKVAVATADGNPAGCVASGSPAGGDGDAGEAGEPAPVAVREPVRQPTVRDLLTHSAGFTYGIFGETVVDEMYRRAELITGDMTLNEFVTRLSRDSAAVRPGHPLALQRVGGCAGGPGGGRDGHELRRVPVETHLRAPGHDGYGLRGAGRRLGATRPALQPGGNAR